MKTLHFLTLAGTLALGGAALATAQTMQHNSANHDAHHMAETAQESMTADALSEPGQGAFAALSEIVAVLEANPDTDWSKVNIAALRDHLIDMDVLVRDAIVSQKTLPNGVTATVTGDAESLATAKRMVPAHAHELSKDDRWVVKTETAENAVTLTVTSDNPQTAMRIKALGFYGLMASQDHHRAHHFIIATGGDAHAGH